MMVGIFMSRFSMEIIDSTGMRIIDQTGNFSEQHLHTLSDFVETGLLSNRIDRDMLYKIVIAYRPDKDCDGSWSYQKIKEKEETTHCNIIRCVIFLNTFYLELPESPDNQIEQLKRILAHEYGHHWTLSHLIKNLDFNHARDRLPQVYYDRRKLDRSICTAFYRDDSIDSWYRCDKEIIAEDYKFLFAEEHYGRPHRIVEEARGIIDLDYPNASVAEFIRNIYSLQSLGKPSLFEKIVLLIESIFEKFVKS
jgi:hypothetical protein